MTGNYIRRLTGEQIDENILNAFENFRKIGRLYRRGLLTDHEFSQRMSEIFYEHFYRFLHQEHGLEFCFTDSTWAGFLEDYRLWQEHSLPKEHPDTPWLQNDNFADSFDSDNDFIHTLRSMKNYGFDLPYGRAEASSYDKIQVFRLMEAFHIPPDYFEPVPAGIIKPDISYIHTYHDAVVVIIGFHCIDDGGLLGDNNPCEKTFTLTNTLGLKAKLLIKEMRSLEEQMELHEDADMYITLGAYLAEGYIEGYTQIQEGASTKIVIRTDEKGSICKLGAILIQDDNTAYRNFPLWQEYFDWFNKNLKKRKEIEENFYRQFKTE